MNKYSNYKIVLNRDKLESLITQNVTAPVYVRIKPTNRCNHNCFFCVYNEEYANMHETMVRRDELSRKKLLEILDDFKKIGVKAITYSGGGEPLVHPDILEIMQKTLDYGIDLSIITNGQKLYGDYAKILTKAKWVRISMDYFDPGGFKQSRRGNEKMFFEIMENIKNFSQLKRDGDFEVNYIITQENHSDLYMSAEILKSLGVDNVRYSPVWIKDLEEYHKPIKDIVITTLKEMKDTLEDKNFKIYSGYSNNSVSDAAMHRSFSKCSFMQIVPVIGADYIVYNCHNQAYSEKGIIGSIKDKSFAEMWFSKETAEHFKTFNPIISCDGIQCTAGKKNEFLNDLLETSYDNFI
jgi:MoaA/NifB/PqqE/SkfB family radical SAM enzyme